MTTPAGMPVGREVSTQLLLHHYATNQQSIAMRVALAIHNLWQSIINPGSFDKSWATLNPVANGIVSTHFDMAAANAAQYYGMARVTAGYPHIGIPGIRPDETYIDKVVNIMGRGQFYHFLKEQDEAGASAMAQDALRGSATRLVMNGGRNTIVQASGMDPQAIGWERIIEAGACGFCAMLAGRGGVYTESTVDFRAHDHCHCVGRPVFKGQTSVNAELSAAWGRETKGTSGKAARDVWDKYWSSRGESQGTESATGQGSGTPSVPGEREQRSAIPHSTAHG